MKKIYLKVKNLLSNFTRPLIPFEGLTSETKVLDKLQSGHWVAMVYLDIMEFQLTEQIYGSLYCKQVLQTLSNIVKKHAPGYLEPYQLLVSKRWGDDLLLYFYSSNLPPPTELELSGMANRVRDNLSRQLYKSCSHLIPSMLNFHAGYALLHPESGNLEKILYTGFKEAVLMAKEQVDAREVARRHQFNKLLKEQNINMVYQPIVALENGEITGYEALSRGPENSFFASPAHLFGYAEKTNQLFALEKLAREKALTTIARNLNGKKLFINISPGVVHDPSFRADEIKSYLANLGATPGQVVFEITERISIENFFDFRKSLEYYRHYGFQVAVDDAGSGYSSLQAIAELQPDYIKIDLSLIKDIDKTPNKRILVETFLTFAEKTGSRIIAEGIESEQELSCLRKMGIPLGQGFFLARPGHPPPGISPRASVVLSSLVTGKNRREQWGKITPVNSICQEVKTFNPSTVTREVVKYFTRYPRVEGVAILENNKPVGLVMRDKLFKQLATQYGFALYAERPISLVMDNNPLVMEGDIPVEQVSQEAICRIDNKVYDSIIICKDKQYRGMVSVRSLLDAITCMQVEKARLANPLTGLPGNRQIDEELLYRLASGQPFSVIYSDLDHFKGFNDCYGFERGDLVIKLTAEIIKEKTARLGRPDDMVGHIGGDDFVVISRPETAKDICRGIIDAFDSRVPDLYDPADRERGYIETRDRGNNPVQLPIMTVSLVIIDCTRGQYQNPEELARAAAVLKKYAKSKVGSVFVMERRSRNNN